MPRKLTRKQSDALAYGLLFLVITVVSSPALTSGDKLNLNVDYFQYAARHEAVRKAVVEHHTFPMRSHWFGGGFPTLGDPEDPSLNPLVLLSVVFGPVAGLKLITYLALLVGALGTYALARSILKCSWWGSLFAGLMFGTSLFVPLRVQDGNPNEVYAAFLPLCLLLIGWACRGRKVPFLVLPFIFYTMLSDGKQCFFSAVLYIGLICLLDLVPAFRVLAPRDPSRRSDVRPLKVLLVALGVTFLIGMVRILPALELIDSIGGLGGMELLFHPGSYIPERVLAYGVAQLWQESLGWQGRQGLVTVGWIPVALFAVALFAFWRRTLAWGLASAVCAWLLLAHNAPFDLLKLSWNLPIFQSIYLPHKYFSFQIAFTVALVSGQFFWLLTKRRPKWVEPVLATSLIVFGGWFLVPRAMAIQENTYTLESPPVLPSDPEGFSNVQGYGLPRFRLGPHRSVSYFNLLRNVGTVDWYTAVPFAENAIPKYFVDSRNRELRYRDYRGEAYFSKGKGSVESTFSPNSIELTLNVQEPDVLIINQNYHPDWQVSKGDLFNKDGLLALRLQDTGSYRVRLQYVLRSFRTGLLVTLSSLAFLVFVCWAYKTGRLQRCTKHDTWLIRRGSLAILWLLD